MDETTAQTFKELQQKFIQLTREKDQVSGCPASSCVVSREAGIP